MISVINRIDEFLNSITMYKAVLYGLLLLASVAILISLLGLFRYPPVPLLLSLSVIILTCYLVNKLFAKLYNAPTNEESYLITALILFFILEPPVGGIREIIPLFLASLLAMASKYVLAIHGRHIFNPTAISVLLLSITGVVSASWWVANPVLLPAVLIIGLLIVRKIRKFQLFLAFALTALIELLIFGAAYGVSLQEILFQAFTSWPILFFGAIMLTEPFTTPPTRKLQIFYGVMVGFVFALQVRIGPFSPTPEFALVVGNIFSYLVSYKRRIFLTLKEKIKKSPTIYEFVFQPNTQLPFNPGQYLEWTLPHKKADLRGNRRYFTIASSPTENDIRLGVRVSKNGSSFKNSLLNLKEGEEIYAGQLSGDFVLPENKNEKLAFIAGGVGATPFRSFIKYLSDKNEKRDIVLFYVCSHSSDFIYKDIFESGAEKIGIKLVYVLTDKENNPPSFVDEVGYINENVIVKYVPDFKNRKFYISGSNMMVNQHKQLLHNLKVGRSSIKTDYFPGY